MTEEKPLITTLNSFDTPPSERKIHCPSFGICVHHAKSKAECRIHNLRENKYNFTSLNTTESESINNETSR